ncbi:hypothetical protein C8R43DRAFT_1107351 [Mycena crocata]|nr:hypothetical protein C8R43DRAFT_1107351 [Mycena crocata]
MSKIPASVTLRLGKNKDHPLTSQLRSLVLGIVQGIYREKQERVPTDFDDVHCKAFLSYTHHSSKRVLSPCSIMWLLPVKKWVKLHIESRLEAFSKRVGKVWPSYDSYVPSSLPLFEGRLSCPGTIAKWGFDFRCSSSLQTCVGCRAICCIKPGCDAAAADSASGCTDHPAMVYCGPCRTRLKPNIPQLAICPDNCGETWCREEFSWCIGRRALSKELPLEPPTTPRLHPPKPSLCPRDCTREYACIDPLPRECCVTTCWSRETGGSLTGMASRAICEECVYKRSGSECLGKHQWICDDCKRLPGPSPPLQFCIECREYLCPHCIPGDQNGWKCVQCEEWRHEDQGEDEPCKKCQRWICRSCAADPDPDSFW